MNKSSICTGPVLYQASAVQLGAYMLTGLIHTCLVHSGHWICDDKGLHDEHHRAFDVNDGVHGWMYKLCGTVARNQNLSGMNGLGLQSCA